MIEHDIGDDAIVAGLLQEVCLRGRWNTHIELSDDTFQTSLAKTLNGVVEFHTIHIANGEVTLQADTVNGNTVVLQAYSKVVERCCLCLALQFYAVVVEIKDGIGIGTVGKDKGRIDIVVANGHLPHTLFTQVVAVRISIDVSLIIVETFVDDIPLTYLTFIVLHHLGDVVLHNLQCLVARPTLVVLLTVGRQPGRLL